MHALLFALMLLAPTPVEPPSTSGDWPLFRGDAGQTGVAKGKLPDKLEVLWKFKAGESIEGAAAVSKGVVYVGAVDDMDGALHAIHLRNGKAKWKYKGFPFKAPPTVKGN